MSRWIGSIGRKGRKALAASTLNILPKLELAVIFTYFTMFPKVFLPSCTPFSSTIRSFSSRMMSALSLAISTAESTEIPMSDSRRAAASLIPSPRNPTVLLLFCRSWMISAFCIGVSFEKMLHFITASSLASLLIFSSSGPVTESEVLIPTCLEIAFTTASLSPESTFTSTPCSCSCLMASEADSFGGSRKAR